jgi:PEP-CTERM motif
MRRNACSVAVLALFLLVLNRPLSLAAPITFSFSGNVTNIFDPNSVLAGSTFSPSLGDEILGTYTFDSAAPGFPLGPTTTSYDSSPTPPFGMKFQIGGTSFEAFPGFMVINISNDDPGVGDRYLLFTRPTNPVDVLWTQVGFELGTTTNLNVFDSTALPLLPLDISLFDTQNEFFLTFISEVGDFGFVVGRLSSITSVPEASTLLLLGSGLAGLGALRWRIQRRRE